MTDPLLRVRGLKKHYPIKRGLLGRAAGAVRAVDGVEIPVDHELTGMLQAHLDADGDPGRHVSGDPVPTAG